MMLVTNNWPFAPLPKYTLFAHPKFCITFVFHFSWVLQPSQEELRTKLPQIFGAKKVHFVRCASGKNKMLILAA